MNTGFRDLAKTQALGIVISPVTQRIMADQQHKTDLSFTSAVAALQISVPLMVNSFSARPATLSYQGSVDHHFLHLFPQAHVLQY